MAEVPRTIAYSRPRAGGAPTARPAEATSESSLSASASDPPVRSISAKALKVLGATEDEVRFERALVFTPSDRRPSGSRVYVEFPIDEDATNASDAADASEPEPTRTKAARVLGVEGEPPLEWLKRQASCSAPSGRTLRSKALATLGVTIDDVRIEKALLVLGEAPGREVPSGRLPRPVHGGGRAGGSAWAVRPAHAEAPSGCSVFLLGFLPWGLLAPPNILKLQLNKVSPGAHLWVPSETEQCQAACGVARMWATLFWAMQFANAVASLYLHRHRERGLATLALAHKLAVGAILLKAYADGVLHWPIGLGGPLVELCLAALYTRELRRA